MEPGWSEIILVLKLQSQAGSRGGRRGFLGGWSACILVLVRPSLAPCGFGHVTEHLWAEASSSARGVAVLALPTWQSSREELVLPWVWKRFGSFKALRLREDLVLLSGFISLQIWLNSDNNWFYSFVHSFIESTFSNKRVINTLI